MPWLRSGRGERAGAWLRLEWVLGLVAGLSLLGALGSAELWGRREQRAAAEALDTVAQGHWLVGSIQGRLRLEKPPLPRWITAALMVATGRRDETIVRLPDALAGLALVALVVGWGRSVGGRSVGLAAGFALVAMPFFLIEMRQAGNDGLLALAVGVAHWAALRRWGMGLPATGPESAEPEPGSPVWAGVFHLAVGLGFLCKGPVIFLWVGGPLLGWLAARGDLSAGLRRLASGWGVVSLAILVAVWPTLVATRIPAAWSVWLLEIGQKAGGLGVEHGNPRGSILAEALVGALPWSPLVLASLLGPVGRWVGRRHRRWGLAWSESIPLDSAPLALAWWWAFGPLAVIALWDVAKPNYLLPAAPAWAILAGHGWVRLARRARRPLGAGVDLSRLALQVTWSGLFAVVLVAPVVVHRLHPDWLGVALAGAGALGLAAVLGATCWRRGHDAASLGALASGLVAVALLGFGLVAPSLNPGRGHRQLAAELTRRLPTGQPVWFFDDLDEGVWFYGPQFDLRPIPPRASPSGAEATNRGHTLRSGAAAHGTRAAVARARTELAAQQVAAWAERSGPGSFCLIRSRLLDHLAADLPPQLQPVYHEVGVERPALTLLRVEEPAEVAGLPTPRRR